MSTNSPSVARARFAEGVEPASRTATLSHRDLAEIANVIVRIEALLNAVPESDCADAIERVADIAFVLHERDIEASLCDALDAAVREISTAGARQQASTQRAHQAAELLRALYQRLNEIIARAECGLQRNAKGSVEPSAAAAPSALPITTNAGIEGESLLAARATSSPRSSTPPPWDPDADPGDLFEPVAATPVAARPELEIEAAAPALARAKATATAAPPVNTLVPIAERNGAARAESALHHKLPSARREPTATPACGLKSLGEASPVATPPVAQSVQSAAAPLPRSQPRQVSIEPFAPVRALSEEELIALFS
jgi:hypothetical protein